MSGSGLRPRRSMTVALAFLASRVAFAQTAPAAAPAGAAPGGAARAPAADAKTSSGGFEATPEKREDVAPVRRKPKPEDAALGQSDIGPEGRTLKPYQRNPPTPKADEPHARIGSRRPDGFWHDGFFFRLGAGLGLGTDRLDTGEDGYSFAKHAGRTGRAGGFAFASEVAIGGALADGISVGLGSYTVVTPTSKAGGEGGADYEFALSQLALLGPFAVVYPNPARGLFFQGSLGLSTFVMGFGQGTEKEIRPAQAHTAVGLGAMLGAGHEWFVGREWSAGVEGRLVWAATGGNDAEGTAWVHRSFGLNVLMVMTRN